MRRGVPKVLPCDLRMPRRLLFFGVLGALILFAVGMPRAAHALDVEGLYGEKLHEDPVAPRLEWLGEGEEYLIEREDEDGVRRWYRVATASGDEQLWLDTSSLAEPAEGGEALEVDRVEFSADASLALLAVEREQRWRRSHRARYFVLSIESGQLEELDARHSPQLHPAFSPSGNRVAYVHQGDLFLKDLRDGEVRALTRDGGGHIRNGDPDWVYEEELGYSTAFWWSPDGTSIAFLRSDDSAVDEFPLMSTGEDLLPRVEMLSYPLPGTTNPTVQLGIMDVETGVTRLVPAVEPDRYVGQVQWLDDGRLLLQELDRPQNTLWLSVLLPGESAPTILLEESSPGWIEARSDIRFLEDGAFLRVSARDGFAHVYLHDAQGESQRQITRGRWDVLELLALDERAGWIVVKTDRGDRAQRHLDEVDLSEGRVRRLSDSGGWHHARFDPQAKYYVESWSSISQRPEMLLRETDARLLRVLQAPSMTDLEGEDLGTVRYLEIPVDGGLELPAQLVVPGDFDPTRRYPVLVYCYGGPGSQLVRDRWGGVNELFHRMLVQQGILVLRVDNRGTRGRGQDFLFSVYRRLGQLESEDQIAAANWMAQQDYVDPERIGIWGWSYGGYLSAMSILRGEGSFRCAASVAPVADWSLYDSIYTERYMGTPQDNPDGYREGSLFSFADGLQGSLFLLHGTRDDNVHVQNTLRLARMLQEEDILFEMMLYPDEAHAIDGEEQALHLRRSLAEFFLRCLAEPVDLETDSP